MPTSATIKTNAKLALKDHWPVALGIGAIILSVYCLNTVIMQIALTLFETLVNEIWLTVIALGVMVLFCQFFFAPLLYGALRWFWFVSKENDVSVIEIFYYFSSLKLYLRALSLSIRIFTRIIGVLFICFLPAFIVGAVSSPTTYEIIGSEMPSWATYVWLLFNVLAVFGVIMSFIMLLRYFAAPVLMINDGNISPQEALHLSVIISKNANGKTFSFVMSFFAWGLLSLLYIPMIFTLPYFICSYAIYCKSLIANYNNVVSPPPPTFTGYNTF